MIKKIVFTLFVMLVLMLPDIAIAQITNNVVWTLAVHNLNTKTNQNYVVSAKGGNFSTPGNVNCLQNPIKLTKTSAGDVRESVMVTCDFFTHKVNIMTSCSLSKSEYNYSVVNIEGTYYDFTITLTCKS